MKKASKYRYLEAFVLIDGRGERIRTFDPLVPNQMRYQAALRPDCRYCNDSKQLFWAKQASYAKFNPVSWTFCV